MPPNADNIPDFESLNPMAQEAAATCPSYAHYLRTGEHDQDFDGCSGVQDLELTPEVRERIRRVFEAHGIGPLTEE